MYKTLEISNVTNTIDSSSGGPSESLPHRKTVNKDESPRIGSDFNQTMTNFISQVEDDPNSSASHSQPQSPKRRSRWSSQGGRTGHHTWLTDCDAPPGTFAVIDPKSRRLHIPVEAIMETKARHRQGVPSLCLIYLAGRCRQGAKCFQAHADAKVVEELRARALQEPTCCQAHGVSLNSHTKHLLKSFPPTALVAVFADRSKSETDCSGDAPRRSSEVLLTVPLRHVSITARLVSFFESQFPQMNKPSRGDKSMCRMNPITIEVPLSAVCRLHLQRGDSMCCRFDEHCKFVHLCREMAATLPDLGPINPSAELQTNTLDGSLRTSHKDVRVGVQNRESTTRVEGSNGSEVEQHRYALVQGQKKGSEGPNGFHPKVEGLGGVGMQAYTMSGGNAPNQYAQAGSFAPNGYQGQETGLNGSEAHGAWPFPSNAGPGSTGRQPYLPGWEYDSTTMNHGNQHGRHGPSLNIPPAVAASMPYAQHSAAATQPFPMPGPMRQEDLMRGGMGGMESTIPGGMNANVSQRMYGYSFASPYYDQQVQDPHRGGMLMNKMEESQQPFQNYPFYHSQPSMNLSNPYSPSLMSADASAPQDPLNFMNSAPLASNNPPQREKYPGMVRTVRHKRNVSSIIEPLHTVPHRGSGLQRQRSGYGSSGLYGSPPFYTHVANEPEALVSPTKSAWSTGPLDPVLEDNGYQTSSSGYSSDGRRLQWLSSSASQSAVSAPLVHNMSAGGEQPLEFDIDGHSEGSVRTATPTSELHQLHMSFSSSMSMSTHSSSYWKYNPYEVDGAPIRQSSYVPVNSKENSIVA